MPCSRCETLPTLDRSPGRLSFWFPLGHSTAKAMRTLAQSGAIEESDDGMVSVDVPDGRPEDIANRVAAVLSDTELDDTRCLFKTGGSLPTISDVSDVRSLRAFRRLYTDRWFLDVLAHNRLASVFQPIVEAAHPERVHGREALVRGIGEDGIASIAPHALFNEARDTGLLFNLDLACRKSAIGAAHQRGFARAGDKLFVNFTPTSIYDPAYCLRSTMAAIDAAGIARSDVVFEVIETERASDIEHLRAILAFYRGAGFKVALDDIGAGYSSLNLIHQLRPDYVKLDMQLIRDVDTDRFKGVIAAKVLEIATELEIATIAEGIETAGELAWCAERGATYAQGYYIGRPA